MLTWLSALIFSAAFKQYVVIASSNFCKSVTFFPKDLDTQQFFLFSSFVSNAIQDIPRNYIAVLEPSTFVPFLTQVLEAVFNL